MKRSEAHKIIYDAMFGTTAFNSQFDHAKYVLYKLEEAGMLPPLRKGEPDSLFNLTQEFIDEHNIQVNEWEKE